MMLLRACEGPDSGTIPWSEMELFDSLSKEFPCDSKQQLTQL
jgi:hypothetical protein